MFATVVASVLLAVAAEPPRSEVAPGPSEEQGTASSAAESQPPPPAGSQESTASPAATPSESSAPASAEGAPAAAPGHGIYKLSLAELLALEIPDVVTASRKAESIDVAPNLMYVVTKEQIRRRGYTCLRDLLNGIPGTIVNQKDIQYVAAFRGIAPNDTEKFAIMINGISVNGVTEPDLLNGPINLDFVERVEVIVGPGSVLYGADTLVAIVNMITREEDKLGVAYAYGNGVDRNVIHSGTLSYGKKWGDNRNVYTSASFQSRAGYDAFALSTDSQNVGLHEKSDVNTDNRYGGRLYPSYTLLGRAQFDDWSLQAAAIHQEAPELHFQGWGVSEDGRWYNYDEHIVLKNTKHWSDSLSTFVQASFEQSRYIRSILRAGTRWDPLNPNYDCQYDMTQKTLGGEVAVIHSISSNYLQIGVQAKMRQNRHNYVFSMAPDLPSDNEDIPGENPGDPSTANPERMNSWINQIVIPDNTYAVGAYISDEYKLNDMVTLVGAIRADHDTVLARVMDENGQKTDEVRIELSPRASVIVRPSESWVAKLMFNTATRYPAPWMSPSNQIFGRTNADVSPAWASENFLVLRPERLSTLEFQNVFYPTSGARTSVSLFYQRLDGFTSWFSPFSNVGNFRGYGGTIESRANLTTKLEGWFDLSYMRNEFTLTSEKLESGATDAQLPVNNAKDPVAAPQVIGNLGLQYEILENLYVTGMFNYFTRQPMYYQNAWTFANNRYYLDVGVSYDDLLGAGLNLSVVGKNILNNKQVRAEQYYKDVYQPEGVSVLAKLEWAY